jgi:hypothetical protein
VFLWLSLPAVISVTWVCFMALRSILIVRLALNPYGLSEIEWV